MRGRMSMMCQSTPLRSRWHQTTCHPSRWLPIATLAGTQRNLVSSPLFTDHVVAQTLPKSQVAAAAHCMRVPRFGIVMLVPQHYARKPFFMPNSLQSKWFSATRRNGREPRNESGDQTIRNRCELHFASVLGTQHYFAKLFFMARR